MVVVLTRRVWQRWMPFGIVSAGASGGSTAAQKGVVMQVDPITVEIIKGALKAAGREMGLLIERTAMSAFIREKKDFFAGVYDTQGHLVYTYHGKFGPGIEGCFLEVYPSMTMAPADVTWLSRSYLSLAAIAHS